MGTERKGAGEKGGVNKTKDRKGKKKKQRGKPQPRETAKGPETALHDGCTGQERDERTGEREEARTKE